MLELKREFLRSHIQEIEKFLVRNFHLPPPRARNAGHFPPLPLVLSLVDTALDRRDDFANGYDGDTLRKVRDALEYAIFALLEYSLRSFQNHYRTFLGALYANVDPDAVTVISLNYDIIVDNAIPAVRERRGLALPDYGCDIATPAYLKLPKFGRLLKPHGSLNWLYCPNCQRLDLGVARSGHTVKVLKQLYRREQMDLNDKYTSGRAQCRDCDADVRPVLITPTHLKDYRNPHISRVWYEAARDLREATRAIFVGYSMPPDDVEVIYLFKRGLVNVEPQDITVVEHPVDGDSSLGSHPAGRQYRALFGDGIDWQPIGFEAWVAAAAPRTFRPKPRRSPAPA